MQVTCINRKTRRLRSFLWWMHHFLYFFSYIFNKNKEDCIFLINISCFWWFFIKESTKKLILEDYTMTQSMIQTMTELWICT